MWRTICGVLLALLASLLGFSIFVAGFACGLAFQIAAHSQQKSWIEQLYDATVPIEAVYRFRALSAYYQCNYVWQSHLRNIELEMRAIGLDLTLVRPEDIHNNLSQIRWAVGKALSVLSATAVPLAKLALGN